MHIVDKIKHNRKWCNYAYKIILLPCLQFGLYKKKLINSALFKRHNNLFNILAEE